MQWRDIANAQPGSALHNDIVRWANRVRLLGNHPAQPNRKAQWFTDARALFKKPGWEGFKAVLYYNKTSKYPNCRWFVGSSQASLTAFAGMANDDVDYTRDEP